MLSLSKFSIFLRSLVFTQARNAFSNIKDYTTMEVSLVENNLSSYECFPLGYTSPWWNWNFLKCSHFGNRIYKKSLKKNSSNKSKFSKENINSKKNYKNKKKFRNETKYIR